MSDGSFVLRYPEALALALPALLAWWALARRGRARWWRLAVMMLIVLAAAGPEVVWLRGGSDVIVVLDRSSSMGDERKAQQELVGLVREQADRDDRMGVVSFGDGTAIVMPPSDKGEPRLADRPVPEDASDLTGGLRTAAGLIPPGRSGRIVVVSDGELTGLGPRRIATALALRSIPIDVLPVVRPPLPDTAVVDVELPSAIRTGESFIGAVRFTSDAPGVHRWRLVRTRSGSAERVEVASGQVTLEPGRAAAVRFADRPRGAGVVRYEATLEAAEDRIPANNKAIAALRVDGGERILVVGGDGSPGNVSRALEAAGLRVDRRPEGPVSLEELAGVRALILEQVPAGKLGIASMTSIARWVEHFGGGLVLTGGRRSFGAGGYHKSPVEAVLPVTMELRDEHRKLSVAMAITLDRSGSMGATVAGGTKMDLANAGAVAAIELLGPHDQVAVHAVDTVAHVVVELSDVTDAAGLASRVRGIRSAGGGIYVYEALRAAGMELLGSSKSTRHLVMFADAADAENPGDWKKLVASYRDAGITVSVIGLGTDADPDAALLREIAAAGGGRVHFSDAAEDLPRLFAQETVLIARTAWVDQTVQLQRQPALATVTGVDERTGGAWPAVPGYNLTYLRPRADLLATAPGDPAGPAVASWRVGTGRSVAMTVSADGPGSEAFIGWEGYAPLLAGLTRWVAGKGEAAPGVLTASRAGRTVTLNLELDPGQRERWPVAAPDVLLVRDGDLGEPRRVTMAPLDEGRWEATFRLDDDTTVLPTVSVGGQAVLGPALKLPYSPEVEPRLERAPGRAVLESLAADTGGAVREDVQGVFDNPASEGELTNLSGLLVALGLLWLLVEIAVRRMGLTWRRRKVKARDAAPAAMGAGAPTGDVGAGGGDEPGAPQGAPEEAAGLHEALRELRKRRR